MHHSSVLSALNLIMRECEGWIVYEDNQSRSLLFHRPPWTFLLFRGSTGSRFCFLRDLVCQLLGILLITL